MEEITLTANWISAVYPSINGTCTLRGDTRADKFELVCEIYYSTTSKFRPGSTVTFKLQCVRESSRIIAQTYLEDPNHFLATINFDKHISCFYSTVMPMDCGTLRPIESRAAWLEAFKI